MNVFVQFTVLVWLKANIKTGSKKNENGNRKCFTVSLSNHLITGVLFILYLIVKNTLADVLFKLPGEVKTGKKRNRLETTCCKKFFDDVFYLAGFDLKLKENNYLKFVQTEYLKRLSNKKRFNRA